VLLQTLFPITRLPAVVRNGEYSDAPVHFEVYDVVRETSDRHCSHEQVSRHARYRGIRSRASQGFGRGFHPRHRRTRHRGVLCGLHTNDRRGGTQRPPRPQIERGDSPLSKFGFGTSSNVFPRHAGRLASHHSAGSPFDFSGPRCLDFSGVLGFSVIQISEEFGCHIGAFGYGQSQGFTKKFLRSGSHVAILDPAGQPNKRLHQTAACFSCRRW
jgi:hypothetical protein